MINGIFSLEAINLILSLIAIVVSVVIYFAERKRKSISAELISHAPILKSIENVTGKIKVSVNGETVNNLDLLVIKLSNTGNLPIVPADYLTDLQINFSRLHKIYDVEVYETTPKDVVTSIKSSENKLLLQPTLLNPGDALYIRVLSEPFAGELTVNGRITGISKFAVKTRINSKKRFIALGIALILSLIVNYTNTLAVLFPVQLSSFVFDPEVTLLIQIISYGLLFYAAGLDILASQLFTSKTKTG